MVCSAETAEAFLMEMVEPGRFWVRSVWKNLEAYLLFGALELCASELCERRYIGGAGMCEG